MTDTKQGNSPSFRPSAARAGIQPFGSNGPILGAPLDSGPGLLSAGVTFFRGNDMMSPFGDFTNHDSLHCTNRSSPDNNFGPPRPNVGEGLGVRGEHTIEILTAF